jgi:hypothetical protein
MDTTVEAHIAPKAESDGSNESYEKHIEASESVVRIPTCKFTPIPSNKRQRYAKICSDYLVGQAESIEQLAHIISSLSIRTNVVLGAQDSNELAYTSRALAQALRELEDTFEQFESDSTGFVHFLRNGDDWEGSQLMILDDHASEIMLAVAAARAAVKRARKAVSSIEYESVSLSGLLDSVTVSGSSVSSVRDYPRSK